MYARKRVDTWGPAKARASWDARAFSLAELMIALAILGFGLLVITAALPVGMSYTRAAQDGATGEAAVEYALDVIEQNVRRCRDPWWDMQENPAPADSHLRYHADVFEPRRYDADETVDGSGLPMPDLSDATRAYEPIVKVRPLYAVPVDGQDGKQLWPPEDLPGTYVCPLVEQEHRISLWFQGSGITIEGTPPVLVHREYEYSLFDEQRWIGAPLASILGVYPPPTPNTTFAAQQFFLAGTPSPKYGRRPIGDEGSSPYGVETRKILERRVSWVAFYRRVSYAPGSDPSLYEVVVVATRVPEPGYRYPLLNSSWMGSTMAMPGGGRASYAGGSTAAPVPYLIMFDDTPGSVPVLQSGSDYEYAGHERVLNPNFVAPPTLTFVCGPTDGLLLPPGSIFIPAVNDDRPSIINVVASNPYRPDRLAGFVPHAPEVMPVYEVVDRIYRPGSPPTYDIVVKNNGYYPWLDEADASNVNWPVWVIPPAFREFDSSNQPVYDAGSPVLTWGRRTIRLQEVP